MADSIARLMRYKDGRLLASTAALSMLFNVDKSTIADWAKKGLPRVSTGWYDLQGVLEYKAMKSSDKGESLEEKKMKAELRYREARAANEELKQSAAIGLYVPVAEIESNLKETFSQVRATLLGIGQKTLAEIYGQYPEIAHEVKHIVEREVERGLTQLAAGKDFAEQRRIDGGGARQSKSKRRDKSRA